MEWLTNLTYSKKMWAIKERAEEALKLQIMKKSDKKI